LWENPEISQYLIAAAVEIEDKRINDINENKELLFWIARSVGLLHFSFHNSGMSGYEIKLSDNPAYETMPERVRKTFGFEAKVEKVEMTADEWFLKTATRSQKEAYFLQKNKA